MTIPKAYLKYSPLTLLVISTDVKKKRHITNKALQLKLWNLKNEEFFEKNENELKELKKTAVAQLLSTTPVREKVVNNLFDKHCGKRKGQATLHFSEDTIRGGTMPFSNIKRRTVKHLENTLLRIFTIPIKEKA